MKTIMSAYLNEKDPIMKNTVLAIGYNSA